MCGDCKILKKKKTPTYLAFKTIQKGIAHKKHVPHELFGFKLLLFKTQALSRETKIKNNAKS